MPMTTDHAIRDFRKDYFPLQFRGFGGQGQCFLRVWIADGKFLVLCAQLPEYFGTSVTNGMEAVQEAVVKKLLGEKSETGESVLEIRLQFPFIRSLISSQDSIEADIFSKAIQIFMGNCLWIEHYSRSTGIVDQDSYAVVSFGHDGAPSWSYVSRNSIEKMLADPSFIEIDYGSLSTWTTQSM